jgi:secretion/DNA translocation related TadE-like protein
MIIAAARSSRPIEGEAGSVSVFAVAVLLLACVLALVAVDLFRALQAKARAQTAADAAALAAAQEIVRPSGQTPEDVAARYAVLNGGTLTSCRCEPGSSEAVTAVEVAVRFVFLGPSRTVTERARAVIGPDTTPASRPSSRGALSTMAPDAWNAAAPAK